MLNKARQVSYIRLKILTSSSSVCQLFLALAYSRPFFQSLLSHLSQAVFDKWIWTITWNSSSNSCWENTCVGFFILFVRNLYIFISNTFRIIFHWFYDVVELWKKMWTRTEDIPYHVLFFGARFKENLDYFVLFLIFGDNEDNQIKVLKTKASRSFYWQFDFSLTEHTFLLLWNFAPVR